MDYSKQAKLVRRLVILTRDGSIHWKPYLRECVFQVSISENKLRIGLEEGRRPEEASIVIQFVNGDGVVVGSFSSLDLQAKHTCIDPQPWFRIMTDLFVEARRMALGADKEIQERVIDEILSDLDFRTLTPRANAIEERSPATRTQAPPLEFQIQALGGRRYTRQHRIATGEPAGGP